MEVRWNDLRPPAGKGFSDEDKYQGFPPLREADLLLASSKDNCADTVLKLSVLLWNLWPVVDKRLSCIIIPVFQLLLKEPRFLAEGNRQATGSWV